jgi:hypothetical protein
MANRAVGQKPPVSVKDQIRYAAYDLRLFGGGTPRLNVRPLIAEGATNGYETYTRARRKTPLL